MVYFMTFSDKNVCIVFGQAIICTIPIIQFSREITKYSLGPLWPVYLYRYLPIYFFMFNRFMYIIILGTKARLFGYIIIIWVLLDYLELS